MRVRDRRFNAGDEGKRNLGGIFVCCLVSDCVRSLVQCFSQSRTASSEFALWEGSAVSPKPSGSVSAYGFFFVHFRAVLRISLRSCRTLAADFTADCSSHLPASNVVCLFSFLFARCCERKDQDARDETPLAAALPNYRLFAWPSNFWQEHRQMPSVL